jgi:signal transduction histidine kinase
MVSPHTMATGLEAEKRKRFDLDAFLDYFIPSTIRAEPETHRRARMFMLSHVFGPFLGNVIPLYLFWAGFPRDHRLWVFSASVTLFWAYPFVLRATGRYQPLAFLSIQNLVFCILWACYSYGGIYSPFLPWILTAPLLSFFYLPSKGSIRNWILVILGANISVFGYFVLRGDGMPSAELSGLQFIGIVSTISVSIYVAMMATYYARMLASQHEFEREVQEHVEVSANLQRITEAATRASAAKSEFVASMSHELRTPLNAVIGYSQLLLEDAIVDEEKEVVGDLANINNAGRHLLALIDDILDFSKIEAGKMHRFINAVRVEQSVRQLDQEIGQDVDRKSSSISISVAQGCDQIFTDWTLVKNALHRIVVEGFAGGADGGVTLSCQPDEHSARPGIIIFVSGNASDLTPEKARRMFSVFTSGSDVSATKYGGAGIGLALAFRFISLIEGSIDVDQEQAGRIRFIIRIPSLVDASDQLDPIGNIEPSLMVAVAA